MNNDTATWIASLSDEEILQELSKAATNMLRGQKIYPMTLADAKERGVTILALYYDRTAQGRMLKTVLTKDGVVDDLASLNTFLCRAAKTQGKGSNMTGNTHWRTENNRNLNELLGKGVLLGSVKEKRTDMDVLRLLSTTRNHSPPPEDRALAAYPVEEMKRLPVTADSRKKESLRVTRENARLKAAEKKKNPGSNNKENVNPNSSPSKKRKSKSSSDETKSPQRRPSPAKKKRRNEDVNADTDMDEEEEKAPLSMMEILSMASGVRLPM